MSIGFQCNPGGWGGGGGRGDPSPWGLSQGSAIHSSDRGISVLRKPGKCHANERAEGSRTLHAQDFPSSSLPDVRSHSGLRFWPCH